MARRSRSGKADKKGPKGKKVKGTKEVPDRKKAITETVKETQRTAGVEKAKKSAPGLSGFKLWWGQNRSTVLILLGIFVIAFLMREFFYYQISFNTWPPNIVGNDPSYHKRVIDFVQEDFHHLRIDGLLNYPLSSGNPRPPIFDWSIAILGIALSPLFGFNVSTSTWVVYQFSPAVWGAITIFPMYLLGKEVFGRKAGIMAAFFLAITSSHIERSTLGFTDHDSFVVFFVVLSMYFLSKSFSVQKERNYIGDWTRPDQVILGFRSFFTENRETVLYAALTGVSMSIIALTWQGYAYVMAILLIYYMAQLLLHRFRNEDAIGTFIAMYISMGMVVILSLPYYYSFTIAVWSQGFYIFLAMTMLGLFIVPTRDIPWLIVIPTLLLFLGASYFILNFGFPETAQLLFSGGGYFASNKLYDTIAEAQSPELSRLVFTFGPGTFFLALGGVVMAFIKIPKNMRKDYIVIFVWTAVAIFMAMSATRFNFNATPAFALLAGWALIEAVRWLKAGALSIMYSIIAALILFIGLGIVREGWSGPIVGNYMLITIMGTVLISLGIFGFMKYRRHRDWFKFRKVITAMLVGFVIIMPNLFFAVDASIPLESKSDFDPELAYLGSFGSSLHSEYWMDSYQWLAEQDLMKDGKYVKPEDRPGFMSWWDYGFDQLLLGKHPTAADNFQNGYHFTGSMIASQNETEAISLMTARIIEGDYVRNKGEFSKDVWDVLVEHLGDDRNSSYSAWGIRDIYRRSSYYQDIVMENPEIYGNYVDITAPNARYAATRVVFTRLGEEGVVDLYRGVTEVTGDLLSYFAVDYRLFPFSSSNTGIFYAPITLADRKVDDYLEYKVYAQENTRGSNEDPVWTDYPDNPISMKKAEEESARLGYKFRILRYDMYYTDMFYNSLFYKTYIGWSPDDVGAYNDGKAVPAMFGDLQNMPAMQGWNMTHFKLVYRTMYYSEKEDANASFPDDYSPMSSQRAIEIYNEKGGDIKSGLGQGTFYLKYYHGAILKGRVRTEDGTSSPGVRVTVLDDYGIPHGNVITGPDGEYELIVPPGDISVLVSTGSLENQYDKLYQFQVDQSTGQPMNAINYTQMTISEDQAMRRVDDGIIDRDIIIRGIPVGGNVYWDTDGDSTFSEESDSLITEGSIEFVHAKYDHIVFGPYELDETGQYIFEELVPGRYDIVYNIGSREEVIIRDFNVDPQDSGQKDLRLDMTEIKGNVRYVNGVPLKNRTLTLTSTDGEIIEITTDGRGNYSAQEIFPGIYELEFNDDHYYHDPVHVEIDQGETLTRNITLVTGNNMKIRARYPASYSYGKTVGDTVKGAVVSMVMRSNVTRRWTTVTDEKGEVDIQLPVGSYDIMIHSVERKNYWSYIGNTFLYWDSEEFLTPVLEPAFRVNGTLTKVINNPHNNTEVIFIRQSDNIQAHAFSNRGGHYVVYLPLGDYTVIVDNRTLTNVSYYQIKELRSPEKSTDIQFDIWTPKTVTVSGRVFIDKDGNGRFTGEDVALQDGNLFPVETGIANARILFSFKNGSLRTDSDFDGLYSIDLPPGDFQMVIDIDGYDHFVRDVVVEDNVSNMNYGLSGIHGMMQPRTRDVAIEVFYNYYGQENMTKHHLNDLEVRLITMEPYMGDREITYATDEEGMIYTEIFPGEYVLESTYEYDVDGVVHTISLSEAVEIEPGGDLQHIEARADHMVAFSGTMFLVENDLVRYPGEMSVNIMAIKGQRVTLESTETDFNGRFSLELHAGDYILEAHNDRPAAHYLYLDIITVDDDMSIVEYEMTQAIPVDGDIIPAFEGIKDSGIFFEMGNLYTSTGINEDGHFSLFIFPGEYSVKYFFQTQESSGDDGYIVEYHYNETVLIDEAIFGLEIEVEKWIELQGAIYYDINNDRIIDITERIENGTVILTPLDTGHDPITVQSDPDGDYRALVPLDRIQVNVDIDGYGSDPREDLMILDLRNDPLAFRDIAVVPDDIPVNGFIYLDSDGNGNFTEDDRIASHMDLEFTDDDGSSFFARTDASGRFSLELAPAIYQVYGMKYSGGKPVMGYLNELNIDMGDDLEGQEWIAVQAARYSGSLYYKDTDGVVHYDLPSREGSIKFHSPSSRGEIITDYRGITFQVDLPFYEYYVSSDITTSEYGMDMIYRISEQIFVDSSTGPEDLSLEFKKSKEYTFNLDLVNYRDNELRMGTKDTRIVYYFVENVGNEPFEVTITNSEKPEGWIVEMPESENIPLDIGEKVYRQVNITTPSEPTFFNSLKFNGNTEQGTGGSFQIQVLTPSSYKFDLSLDMPKVVGMGYGETKVFNLTVENMGLGEDVVNVKISPRVSSINDWEIEWQGEPGFPDEGENVSLTPKGVRKFAITIRAPDLPSDDQTFNEKLTLTFVGVSRRGEMEKESIRFEMTRPNLVLPPGYLKLSNRRLDDPIMNMTVEANITVASLYKDSGKVNVSLKVDGKVVAEGTIPYIPQDGTGHVRVRFNVSEHNISKDDFHTFEVLVDPYNTIRETDDYDNVGVWYDVAIGKTPQEEININWRIVIFVALIILIALGVVAYRERLNPI